MDSRQTLGSRESFAELLRTIHEADEKAHLLIDDNGITRVEGYIETLSTNSTAPFIELENGLTIPLHQIIAVNGVFRPDYSEC
jgi:hypothetical protein